MICVFEHWYKVPGSQYYRATYRAMYKKKEQTKKYRERKREIYNPNESINLIN